MTKAGLWIAVLACLLLGAESFAQAGPSTHTLVLIRSERGAFTVVGRREVPGVLPRAVPNAAHQEWSFEALDTTGAVVHTGALPNPQIVRGEFKDPRSGQLSGVQLTSGAGVTFALRVPSSTNTLVLYGIPIPATLQRTRGRTAAPSGVLARIKL